MRIDSLICAAAFSVFVAQGALAFDAAAPDGSNGAQAAPNAAPAAEDPGARSARSIECSQKADARDLHGKPRKRFMRSCSHGA